MANSGRYRVEGLTREYEPGLDGIFSASIQRAPRRMIANDHPIMRVGLRLAVRRERDMEIVRETRGTRETIEEFQRLLPDVIILDLDSLNRRGPDTVQGIRHWSQAASTIVVSAKSRISRNRRSRIFSPNSTPTIDPARSSWR